MSFNRSIKYLLFVAVASIVGVKAKAQENSIPKEVYTAANIPDSLKEDANSVLRYGMQDVVLKGPGKSVTRVHNIVTILNEKGNDEAEIVLPYNKKFSTVGAFEMLVYDANGKIIKKYHKSDLYEHAAVDDETLASDDRLMLIRHEVASYPTTVEMIFEIDNSSLINVDSWRVQRPEQSIQNSYYHIVANPAAGFRYLNKNTSVKPQKSKLDDMDSYTWQVSNLKAFKLEDGALSWRVLPKIDFAANNFEFYGLPGDISTWQNYGKWQKALNADVGTLSPQRVAEIQQMTANLPTDKEKAKFLYEYMEHNMRYVSIQLGIGGLKPFPAMFVDQKKYGDCKALSNYMVAMLKAVNIPAYYATVRAGVNEEPSDYSFPYDIANHIIVCVPFKNDTTWLECTNSNQPFGKLGPFTENRNALLITEDGGKLVNTPKSTAEDNQFNSETHIILDADGGAKAQVKILSTGGYRDDYVGMASVKTDDQKKFLMRSLKIKQPSVFDLKDSPDKGGIKELNLSFEYDKFCDVSAGDKQFYRPRIFDLWAITVPILEKRKTDYYFEHPMKKSCITTIDLPVGFEVETMPTNTSLNFSYGSYDITYVYDKDKNSVISTAKFVLNTHVIPAAKYTEMQEYMDAIAKAQNKKLVIRKKA